MGAASSAFDLVLGNRTRVPLVRELTIGRGPGNSVRLEDPSVSRLHAHISPPADGQGPVLWDAGSSHGTWVDGRRLTGPLALRDGARIELGDQQLVVERQRDDAEAGRTLLVPPGASILVNSVQSQLVEPGASSLPAHPRLRSGYALKRLETGEGARRWVLRDLVGSHLVRLADEDAHLLQLLDGGHSISDLVREAEQRLGQAGPGRLALLLSDLAAKGLLSGAPAPPAGTTASGHLARVFRSRQKTWTGAGDVLERGYMRGGWLLFTRPGLAAIAVTAAAGLVAFVYLVLARYGTPFVVAKKVGLGGLVFVGGRLAFAAAHEAAHGLTLASFGRKVGEAGVKLVLIFPYTFVDTSDSWFEPRRRRIAVSAAGPVCDLFLGGSCGLACLITPAGTLRDIFFQLAFGAYYGALFNLNPLLERDGYHILVDFVRQPGLRRRALAQLRAGLSGHRSESESRLLAGYALSALAWMLVSGGFAGVLSLRYMPALAAIMPRPVAWTLLTGIWLGLLAPPLTIVIASLRQRRVSGQT